MKKKEPNDSCDNNCGLFDFMANTIGIKVLHPGGYTATDQLCSLMNINERTIVLDLACGVGTTSFYLADKYNCNITGIDISNSLITIAKLKVKRSKQEKKPTFQVVDALKMPYDDNSFDVVIAQAFFILIDNKEQALKEIYRILKPGGFFGSLELSWFKTPPQDTYNELLENTCTTFIPRTMKFEEWEDFFKSAKFQHLKTIKNPMPGGILHMLKAEGLLNFIKIMFKMMVNPITRKKMMKVQNAFGKYNDFIGFGIYCMKKQ
jgi:ubiquinone/menaquinone biosynthesis C-methylase UbiE